MRRRIEARRRLFAAGSALAIVVAALVHYESATHGSPPLALPAGAYSEFGHTIPQHARLPCLLCHQRSGPSPAPPWPGHAPCAGCHAQQFAAKSGPICMICHSDAASGAMRTFPRLRSFGATFDHARHQRGGSSPRGGCVACHRSDRRGKGYSVPSRLAAHGICYSCHAPKAQSEGRDISSCGTCHQLGSPPGAIRGAGAYAVNFAHNVHARAGVKCAECHAVRSGAGRGGQVSRPVALQHRSAGRQVSCGRCHDGKRAFGGDDFTVCSRCHRGETWRF